MNTKPPRVVVIQTGVANTASVLAGFTKAGAEPLLTNDPLEVETSDYVVLPGVGTFGASIDTLKEYKLVEPLRERIIAERPTLLVCVGFQLLFERSSESPGIPGLGIISGEVARFPNSVRVPQFGWNLIEPDSNCRLLGSGYAYFANSYRAESAPDGWSPAYADNGGPFLAGLERGDVLGCQFHPELSSTWGIALLSRWLGSAQKQGVTC
jgi:imidazole glycerol phosphate synthase glutamine amidotransferase subunit